MIFYNGIPMTIVENPYRKPWYEVNTTFQNESAMDVLVNITKYNVRKYMKQHRMDIVHKQVHDLMYLARKLNTPIFIDNRKKYFIEMKGEQ